ncbi:MAG: L-aspartate oxidase [Bacteroidota bacterium]|nr:L-aspartate oxidase [Bacteroidota bacterium]
MKQVSDFLVIGSGVAGLIYALKAAEHGIVHIITKDEPEQTNTHYAQGGIASVKYAPDNIEKHIRDTIIAGDGLCQEEVVNYVVQNGEKAINRLIKLGTQFDKNSDGKFQLAKEGGHSEHRIFRHKDQTGNEIQRTLIDNVKKHPNIIIFKNHFAIDLITQHHMGYPVILRNSETSCYGAYVLNKETQKIHRFLSKTTFLATGGIGNLYKTTTNPEIATGDGIAMVYRAKGIIRDMEFVQFHPTALYYPKERPAFLITEALRGFGAKLITKSGGQFMHKYDDRKELAPRDIVARAIDTEMKISGDDHVALTCKHLDPEKLIREFPNIYAKCQSIGIDIRTEPIPVVPAAHYLCGGVVTDMNGKSTIKRLYAGGETAVTGLHGANRLASNSLLEAVVFAESAAKSSTAIFQTFDIQKDIPEWNEKGTKHPEEMILITQEFKELRFIMSDYVGIVRSDLRLSRALTRLEVLYRETEALYKSSKVSYEISRLRNAVNVAYLIIKMAKKRKESRGLHYTLNYPEKAKIL